MTKILYKNELEVKFRIENEKAKKEYANKLLQQGFVLSDNHLETDFTFDTADDLCKKNEIILRYRIIGNNEDYLLTMKMKQKNNEFQDHIEIECSESDYDFLEKLNEINRILKEVINKSIPRINPKSESLLEIISRVQEGGFVKNRMLSQKERVKYTKDEMSVCFDTLPQDLGEYIELEAFDDKKLFFLIDYLSPNINLLEKRNYGKLIQDLLQERLVDLAYRRICVFDSELGREVRLKFGLMQ